MFYIFVSFFGVSNVDTMFIIQNMLNASSK